MSDEVKELTEKANGNGTPVLAATEGEEAKPGPAGVEAPSPEQVAEWKAKAAKAQEHWDRLLRQTADFDNFKKRAARERLDAIKYANENLLERLIPVLDNFEAGLAATGDSQDPAVQALKTGVVMVFSQLKSALAEAGLEEIDAVNQRFDPNLHEAISERETADAPEGQVVQQVRRGYRLRDRLLRPASVIVAKKPGA
jgi:molecular chaperone GrpE